ncbi:MAG TPA: ABC transporter ATP-binding protein, partial [Euzebya sp.]|nr:ABC transporter ATP-binding protein [Euzebya sp.]
LMAHRTVAEQLAFPLEVRGVGRADIITRVRAEGMAMGLGRLMGRRPQQLSAGEAQRVSLGRTRTRVAAALLLDEPLSRADAGERARLRADLLAYQRAGEVTMVLATNDHDEALLLADRILVLRAGRTVQVGTPEAILRQPSEEWVAGFVGDPPMGVVDATVEADGAMGWLRVADQRLRVPGGLPGALAQRIGLPLRLGARPHQLRPPMQPDEAVDRRLRAVVGHVTPWPDHQLVQLDLPGGCWQAMCPRGHPLRKGSTVEVVADVRAMSAFDEEGTPVWHGDT